MAECYETVSRDRSNDLLASLSGLRISRTWEGYAKTIFLEIGKLWTETLVLKGLSRSRQSGQICLMIKPQWRVEKRFSVEFGSGFSDSLIARKRSNLKGQIVETAVLTDRLPELQVAFDDGRCLRTFSDWRSQPNWTVLFHDKSLIQVTPVWDGVDVTPCLHVRNGRLEMSYCFDDREIDARRLKQIQTCYRLPS